MIERNLYMYAHKAQSSIISLVSCFFKYYQMRWNFQLLYCLYICFSLLAVSQLVIRIIFVFDLTITISKYYKCETLL